MITGVDLSESQLEGVAPDGFVNRPHRRAGRREHCDGSGRESRLARPNQGTRLVEARGATVSFGRTIPWGRTGESQRAVTSCCETATSVGVARRPSSLRSSAEAISGIGALDRDDELDISSSLHRE